MVDYLKRAFAEGSQITKFNLMTAATVGSSAHFLFFFLFKYQFGLAENVYLRMIAVALCLSLFFVNRIPEKAKPYLPFYWHFCLIFILPFIFTVNLLITDFHELWRYWAIFMVCVVVVYVPNILMILVDLVLGVSLAVAFFVLTTPEIDLHPDFNVTLFAIVIVFTTFTIFLFSHYALRGAQEIERAGVTRALAASIAHEMRNPLAQLNFSLDNIAQRLPNYYPDQRPAPMSVRELEEVYRQVAHGRMAATRGAQVIDMILNEIHDRPIDAAGFVTLSAAQATRRAVDEYGYESPAERDRVHLHLDHDFQFRGDETQLVFVLFNLLKNSLYYLRTRPGGRIDISLRTGDGGNSLSFRDSGPGIAAEEMRHLFDAFYTHGKKGGTGLGLAYCKRVMQAFGGDIHCISQPEVFTEFTLSFPAMAPAKAAAPVMEGMFRGMEALVVDDEPLQRASAVAALRKLGAEVSEAGDGREALEKMRPVIFDLVLMDLNMPVMNGYEAAEAIRAGEVCSLNMDTRIVACTSEPEYIARGKIEKVRMDGLLIKPCCEVQLAQKLARLFEGRPFRGPASVMDAPASPAAGTERSVATGDFKATLLLVDDSELLRSTMAEFFWGRGFEVWEAGNGQEALEALEQLPCDLVISDIDMPGMDGWALTRAIRAHATPELAALPVVGLSGFTEGFDDEFVRETGMTRFLDKGMDLGRMVEEIHSLLAALPERGREGPPDGFDPVVAAAALRVPTNELGSHLARFASEYGDTPRRLREAWSAREWGALQQQAHKLGGAAKLLRASALAEAAGEVERRARERRGEGAAAAVERLVEILERLLRYAGAGEGGSL